MLTVYRRHSVGCPQKTMGRAWRACKCPLWCDGTLEGQDVTQSLQTRNWNRAQAIIREWEAAGRKTEDGISIEDACQKFLEDCKARGLKPSTCRKYTKLIKALETFSKARGLSRPDHLNAGALSDFRSTWTNRNWAALKKFEALRTLVGFWHSREFVKTNAALALKRPIARPAPTLPFTDLEWAAIDSAINSYPIARQDRLSRERLRAFVHILRFTGLRIGDACRLTRDRIENGRLLLHTQKTGVPVHLPMSPHLLAMLGHIPLTPDGFYFTTGRSEHGAINSWDHKLIRLFKLAGVSNGHAHRFRDTFAVELLVNDVPMEDVSRLLGHSSIRVTERHYAPWVQARQEKLEAHVRRVWMRTTQIA